MWSFDGLSWAALGRFWASSGSKQSQFNHGLTGADAVGQRDHLAPALCSLVRWFLARPAIRVRRRRHVDQRANEAQQCLMLRTFRTGTEEHADLALHAIE